MADLTEKEVYAGYGKLKDPVKTHTLQQQIDDLTKRVEFLESFVKPAEPAVEEAKS